MDQAVGKGDFVFLYRRMKEDPDGTIRWHVKCPFCQAGLIISPYGMKLEEAKRYASKSFYTCISLFIYRKMIIKKGHINLYRYNGSNCPLCGRFILLEDLYTEYYGMIPIAGAFRNASSFKEYEISGLCQDCQDMMYGRED